VLFPAQTGADTGRFGPRLSIDFFLPVSRSPVDLSAETGAKRAKRASDGERRRLALYYSMNKDGISAWVRKKVVGRALCLSAGFSGRWISASWATLLRRSGRFFGRGHLQTLL